MPDGKRFLVSIVVPCYNEGACFAALRGALSRLSQLLLSAYDLEFILVDDGSRDSTWTQISEWAEHDSSVVGISLSRNFGHQAALTCGYDMAQGDAVICMDADLQDPPEAIVEMLKKWQEGFQVVYGVRRVRQGETHFKLWTAAAFYRFMHGLGAKHIPKNVGDFRLLDRAALDALGRLREQQRFLRGMVGWIGFRTAEVYYDRLPRTAGETKYPLRKMLAFALDGTFSFSQKPLRLGYYLSAFLILILGAYLAYCLLLFIVAPERFVAGWASLTVLVILLGASNLFCISLLGEYVGRIYIQTKNRPLYLVGAIVGTGRPEEANDSKRRI